jgi:hypothetical protein
MVRDAYMMVRDAYMMVIFIPCPDLDNCFV